MQKYNLNTSTKGENQTLVMQANRQYVQQVGTDFPSPASISSEETIKANVGKERVIKFEKRIN